MLVGEAAKVAKGQRVMVIHVMPLEHKEAVRGCGLQRVQ
jgi:hypothetical protein